MVKLKWTEQAVGDLKNIFDYISNDSIYYAKRQISKIKLSVDPLKIMPKLGRVVPEFNKDNLREIILERYRIVYLIVSPDRVNIITVHHTSKDRIEVS